MTEPLEQSPGVAPALTFAVRPTRGQLGLSRLALFAKSRSGLCALAGFGLVTIGLCSLGTVGLFELAVGFGYAATVLAALDPAFHLALILAAGGSAIWAIALRSGDRLSQAELESGVFLQLEPRGLTCTVRGATSYYDWAYVQVRHCHLGLLFVLPRATFHLLPYDAISREQWVALSALLGPAPRPLTPSAALLATARTSAG